MADIMICPAKRYGKIITVPLRTEPTKYRISRMVGIDSEASAYQARETTDILQVSLRFINS
tara:strand:+ start:111 stop:293 length:183 start_codon:yes stop_codon:yes gene_type:complete